MQPRAAQPGWERGLCSPTLLLGTFLLCTAPALPDLPAQQWEDFPGALTQSHTNPNVFTGSSRLKKENIFRGFPKPELGALVPQPPLMCLCHGAEGLTDPALLVAPKVGKLLPWNDWQNVDF